jgi:hypothetical protein
VRDGEDTIARNSSVSAITQTPLTFNPLVHQMQSSNMSDIANMIN